MPIGNWPCREGYHHDHSLNTTGVVSANAQKFSTIYSNDFIDTFYNQPEEELPYIDEVISKYVSANYPDRNVFVLVDENLLYLRQNCYRFVEHRVSIFDRKTSELMAECKVERDSIKYVDTPEASYLLNDPVGVVTSCVHRMKNSEEKTLSTAERFWIGAQLLWDRVVNGDKAGLPPQGTNRRDEKDPKNLCQKDYSLEIVDDPETGLDAYALYPLSDKLKSNVNELECPPGTMPLPGRVGNNFEQFCIDAHEYTQQERAELVAALPEGELERRAAALAEKMGKGCESEWSRAGRRHQTHHEHSSNMTYIDRPSKIEGLKKPVVNVNFYEALAICQARGMDLPTIQQWQKAVGGAICRNSSYGYAVAEYAYGSKSGLLRENEICFDQDGPCDVKSYPPNDWGLYDLTGNVWEWRKGEDDGCSAGVGGGSWNDYYPKAMTRGMAVAPEYRAEDIGFRCVTDAKLK